ncbi:MAG: hypothetical protein EBS05_10490 [Proteobacteria bacterium]|nr:hypothetical protein [Pseudomonadota bacterium]
MTARRRIGSAVKPTFDWDLLVFVISGSAFLLKCLPVLFIASGLTLLGHITIGVVALYFFTRILPVRAVEMDDDCLYVSGPFKSVSISLRMVASATEHWNRGRPITVEFFETTPVGNQLTFLPGGSVADWFGRIGEAPPLVTEFRNLASHNHADRRV